MKPGTLMIGTIDLSDLPSHDHFSPWLASLFVLYGLLTPRRLGELRMMRWGVVDGMKGVSGKLRR